MGKIILPSNILSLENKVSMAGYWNLKTHKSNGKQCSDTGWFKNLITNRGLRAYPDTPNYGFTNGDVAAQCAVGTGTATPLVTDVGLSNLLATVAAAPLVGGAYNTLGYVAAAGGIPAYWYARYVYTFGTGVAAGNLTEVGAFPGGDPSQIDPAVDMFSRALIVDSGGSPTSITVLSDEILTVTYEVRFYLDVSDTSFTVNLNSTPITGVYRLADMTSANASVMTRITSAYMATTIYSGDIQGVTSQPLTQLATGAPATLVSITDDIVNTGTMYIDWSYTFGTGVGTGTIKSIMISGHMWKYQFGGLSTDIAKSAGQQFRVNFRTVWGRY